MTDDNSSSPASPEDPHLADPTMSLFVKEDAPPSSPLRELEALMLSRVESVGLDSVAQAIGGSAGELFKSYKQDVKKWAELLGLLGLQVSHEPSGSSPAQPYAPLSAPAILQLGEPEEVYRHLDYLTADQALDWMERISGHHVEWHTLWAMVGFEMCDAFMDCRAVRGLTYAAEGEHEHRKVFGLGICQVMNAVKGEGDPLHLLGAAIHVDRYGLEEIVPKRRWWINDLEDYEVLFRPSDIERMGQIVDERGGWSSVEPHQPDEQPPEYNGSELAQRLGKLQISINHFNDRLSYCIKFEDGRLLAELGSDLTPLRAGLESSQQAGTTSHAHESEILDLKELIAAQSEQLLSLQQSNNPEAEGASSGISFPYSTRGLEALRSVAMEKWAGYTPDKRQPTQKEIGYAICEALGVDYQKTNEPPRKAKELATIIRPDDLPDL
ncbi:hypothetical protein [Pseudomonas extremaustralis]|uniref:Uncharacterized protein n=2 Tax=Pseudomonas extremaustralis TaxID=359110 RepID=A0A5C5QNE7_9PSED|nr:hypothetical protein [Pseudomonas extremaustralis]TWS07032.1 hypothetical protein FIV36_03695 [Pseudomonas extremaustralis]